MLDKKFNQDLTTYKFFKRKIDLCQIRSLFTFQTISNFFKTVNKNNPETHSPQQNKKAKFQLKLTICGWVYTWSLLTI